MSRRFLGLAAIAAASLAPGVAPAAAQSVRHEDELPEARFVEVGALDLTQAPMRMMPAFLVQARDGTVFLQGAPTEVLVFDEAGVFRGELGREGGGPGEFRFISQLGMHGDTLWVGDASAGRVTRFLGDHSLVETITPTLPVAGGQHYPNLAPDGSVVALTELADPSDPSGRRHLVWWRWRPDRDGLDTLAASSVPSGDLTIQGPGGLGGTFLQPFAESVPATFSGAATHLLMASASRDGDEGMIVVERLHFDGVRDTAIAMRYRPGRITAATVDSVVAAMVPTLFPPQVNVTSGMRRDAEAQLRRALDVPDYHPPVWDLVQGADGVIWIQRDSRASGDANPAESRVRWVMAKEGVGAVARATLRSFQIPMHASEEFVWLFEAVDISLGLARVAKYRIEIGP